MSGKEPLKSPESLRLTVEGNYVIAGQNGREKTFIPTDVEDGHKLLVVKRSGLDTWGINDEKLFPKSEVFGSMKGSAVAVAVLDGEKLVGFAYGRDNGGTMTFDRVQKASGDVTKLLERITVETKNFGGDTIITSGAEKLSDAVVKQMVAGIKTRQKFEVADASYDAKSPTVIAAGNLKKDSHFLS